MDTRRDFIKKAALLTGAAGFASVLPASHPYKKLFNETAQKFLQTALPNVTSGNYGGDHWLASFAVYAMLE